MATIKALRGRVLWFSGPADDPAHRHHHEDGMVAIADGRVIAAGDASAILPTLPSRAAVIDHRPHLIVPGFIDPHIHFPQTQVIASYGAQLLDWLNRFTFVEEQRFADPAHAARVARFFLAELLRNGTTTAVVYCSVHAASAEAFFAESARRGTRMIAGKVMMDRNCPPALRDTAEAGYRDSKELIARWHGKGRQLYAITPRFAVSSSEEQMTAAGALAAEHPDCFVQTHMSENRAEIALVKELFPDSADYLSVYERFGLVGPRSLIGHCIHLTPRERSRMGETGAVAVFCPTSNLFLGSGLFDWRAMAAERKPVRVAMATDVGGGTSYSMLRTAGAGYQVLQLNGDSFSPFQSFHQMTRGNAEALGLAGVIGGFDDGAEADAVVLNARATPAMAHRMERVETLEDELFVLTTLGDDRSVVATYVMGERVES